MNEDLFIDDGDDVIDITEKEILSQLSDMQTITEEINKAAQKKIGANNSSLDVKTSNDIYDINHKEEDEGLINIKGDLYHLANDHKKSIYKGAIKEQEDKNPVFVSPTQTNAVRREREGALSINIIPEEPMDKSLISPIENDKLLSTVKDRKSINTVMNIVAEELAEEAAYLKAWRNEQWSIGNDVSGITFKRIKTLKSLTDTLVEQNKMKKENIVGKIDFYGEAFNRVLKYFLEVIQQTFHKVNIPPQYESIFFPELAKAFDNFEKKAERLYYGKEK